MNRLALLLLAALLALPCHADEVRVAVAANFTAPMQEIAAAYERESGHRITLSFGSSGGLYAQIVNGAPFDAFLSADSAKPEALAEAGLALPDSRFSYAVGTLVLWSHDGDDALARLKSGDYAKLAVANPRLAPYGAAAMQVLDHLGLGGAAADRLVNGENIGQAYQFISSGNAQLGFVALSQVIRDGAAPTGAWVVPAELHDPIRQEAVLLTPGAGNPAAVGLLEFLRGEAAAGIIHRYGYAPGGE